MPTISQGLFLTVFTPTYNRADKITRVYESLINQTFPHFEWLIIDDGSTDNTKEIVEGFIKTTRFPIKYIRQENSGKHIAINRGLSQAKGEFFLCADSDDKFIPEALQIFYDAWHSIPENERKDFCGIRTCVMDQNGQRMSDDYTLIEPFDANYQEAIYKKKLSKETWWMLKTDLQKKFLFPEIFVGLLVPENTVLREINHFFKTRCINIATRIYYTDYDDLSLMKSNKNINKQATTVSLWAGSIINDYPYFFYNLKLFARAFLTYCVYFPLALKRKELFNRLRTVPRIAILIFLPISIIPGTLFHLYKKRIFLK